MSFGKIQIFFAGTINFITTILSLVFLSDTSYLIKEHGFSIFDYCPIWISMGILTLFTIYFAVYFYLMLFHYMLCYFITNSNNVAAPSFSLCGCIFICLAACSYIYNLQLFSNNKICSEVSNNDLFISTIYLNILNPVIIIFGILIIKLINICLKKNKKNDDYQKFLEV